MQHILIHTILQKAIDQTGVGVVLSNPRLEDNPIIYVSKGFEEITGYHADEVIGRNCRFLQGKQTKIEDTEKIRKAIKEQQSCEVEILNYKKNGEIFWNELLLTPIIDSDGELQYYIGIQKDITTRKQAEEARLLYEKVFQNTLQGVLITDAQTNIVLVNEAFTKITGYSAQEAIGKKPTILSSGKQSASFYKQLWQEINEKGQWEGELWNRRKDGQFYAEFLNISEVRNQHNELTNYVSIFTDITETKNREQQLTTLSMRDSLTNIGNRRAFDQYIYHKWDTLLNEKSPLSLILIDIDYFKQYNDTYGHIEGDEALKFIANQLVNCIDPNTSLAVRYGGEEFAIILPNYAEYEAIIIAKKLQRLVEKAAIPHKSSPIKDILSISCGVANVIPSIEKDVYTLIRQADKALYKAKGNGRNRVELYSIHSEGK